MHTASVQSVRGSSFQRRRLNASDRISPIRSRAQSTATSFTRLASPQVYESASKALLHSPDATRSRSAERGASSLEARCKVSICIDGRSGVSCRGTYVYSVAIVLWSKIFIGDLVKAVENLLGIVIPSLELASILVLWIGTRAASRLEIVVGRYGSHVDAKCPRYIVSCQIPSAVCTSLFDYPDN